MQKNKFLAGLVAFSIFYSGTPASALPQAFEKESGNQKIQHLLNRITFGCSYSDIGLATKMGVERYVEAQLNPRTLPVPEKLTELSKLEALQSSPADLFIKYGRPAIKASMQNKEDKKELNKLLRQANEKLYTEVALNRIARAVESPRQLEEVMTDFWFNHFNVSSDKGLDHLWVGSYEEKAIRPFALGKFRELLGATSHHAAMLFYLDNWQNSKVQATVEDFTQTDVGPGGKNNNNNKNKNKLRNFRGINENYARELMELHTLGVDGGYTQKDVTELARVLTGLGMIDRRALMGRLNKQMKNPMMQNQNRTAKNPARPNRYIRNYGQYISSEMLPGNKEFGSYFDASRHDFGDKIIMGHTIKGEGEKEIERVLDFLARHPSTARHISYKLAQYFVCDKPPQSLVNNLSQVYTKSDGNIANVLKALFNAEEFWDPKYTNAKFKSPYRYLVSTLRATDTKIESVQPALQFLRQTGMPLYKCQTPDGYKNTQEAWLNPDNLINRLNFSTAFCSGRLRGLKPGITESNIVARSLSGNLSDKTVDAIENAHPNLQLSLLIGSPEFMKY